VALKNDQNIKIFKKKIKETGAINDSFLVSGRYERSHVGISLPVQLVISVVTCSVMVAPLQLRFRRTKQNVVGVDDP
jgi:hypothetical protein